MRLLALLATAWPATAACAGAGPGGTDYSQLSLEELADVVVTSVSKVEERLADAAAAVYVISSEDIRRAGATSIPEALRLAPNLQVARVNANQYAISARGFNSTTANKLLVMIDGRSVYTPLYSGVFWDAQDVMLEDVERIEVVSGAGGTLWGANAVNGVINIITRSARDTQGGLVTAGGGNREINGGARYGATVGGDGAFRVYVKDFRRNGTENTAGAGVGDAWHDAQAGFRFDGGTANSTFTLQGDAYEGALDQGNIDERLRISGQNVVGRWNQTLDEHQALQVQAYFDRTERKYPGTLGEVLETWNIDIQHSTRWIAGHEIVWGGGYRAQRDDVTNSAVLAFLPPKRTLTLANLFIQDSVSLGERFRLIAGARVEHNSYTGVEVQPNVRLSAKVSEHALAWGAVSRAVRTPSRFDRDLYQPGTAPFLIAGGPDFVAEKLVAYELGYRAQPHPAFEYTVTAFANVYDDLRTVEPTAGGVPYVLANKMRGDVYGLEAWGTYRAAPWWTITGGVTLLRERLKLTADSGDPIGTPGAGNDPRHQALLRSSMNLAHGVELDVGLRTVGRLPNPAVPAYTAFDARIGWKATRDITLSLTGTNLFDSAHAEFGSGASRSEFGRAVFANVTWRI